MLGMALSEFHSGYRLYSCEALKKIPFHKNTHDFHFDTQIIIQFHAAGLRIVELPIPTYYGDEICRVEGLRYARDVVAAVMRYRRTRSGGACAPEFAEYFPPEFFGERWYYTGLNIAGPGKDALRRSIEELVRTKGRYQYRRSVLSKVTATTIESL